MDEVSHTNLASYNVSVHSHHSSREASHGQFVCPGYHYDSLDGDRRR